MKFEDVVDDWIAAIHYIFILSSKEVIEDPESEVETIEHAWELPGA